MNGQPRTDQKRPRGTGCIYQQKGSSNWWIQYYRNGKPYRESTGSTDRRKAERMLRQKQGEIATNTFIEPKAAKTLVSALAEDVFQDYRVNGKKSLSAAKIRWKSHLQTEFGHLRAANIGKPEVMRYIEKRQTEGAANATINREVSFLKRCFTLGVESRKVHTAPKFPHLEEHNVRKGFVEDAHYDALARECSTVGLWLRAMLEVGSTFGWRVDELKTLRVNQVDLSSRTVRLEPGETKNKEGRTAVMTGLVYALLEQCVTGKEPDDLVFTRDGGISVGDFRKTWARVCCAAGLGRMVCPKCSGGIVGEGNHCGKCSRSWKNRELKFAGLLFHDLRRTGVRNMVRAGVPERVAMSISGHKTRSVFDRYDIVSARDLQEAARKMEAASRRDEKQSKHSSDIVATTPQPGTLSANLN